MGIKSIALVASTLVLSTSVNAVVINTLNGVDYQWLELTETKGLSRAVVDGRLADSNDILFGYEYASRQLMDDLFSSYLTFDGINGWHGAPSVTAGAASFINDFGALITSTGNGNTFSLNTVDGYHVTYTGDVLASYGLYGLKNECGTNLTCLSFIQTNDGADGAAVMTYLESDKGFDAQSSDPTTTFDGSSASNRGSYLVKLSAVPVPASIWLFGSGLLGLIGVARRKKA